MIFRTLRKDVEDHIPAPIKDDELPVKHWAAGLVQVLTHVSTRFTSQWKGTTTLDVYAGCVQRDRPPAKSLMNLQDATLELTQIDGTAHLHQRPKKRENRF